MNLIKISRDFKQRYEELGQYQNVVSASEFTDRVIDKFYGEKANCHPVTPWETLGDRFQMRPGEVTVWVGTNGHGKTLATSQVALHLLVQNYNVCIASFEMKGEATMARMVKQSSGTGQPSVDYIKRFHAWTDDKLWLFDHQGICPPEQLFGVMLHAAEDLGVKHFFVDSMMKVVRGDDDYNGQKDFVNEVCAIAQRTDMHVHLVAHTKKMENELSSPGKFDVKGSSSITDLADNVAIVYRNRKKEAEVVKCLNDSRCKPEELEAARKNPDAYITWVKQRHYDWEGAIKLYFDVGPQSFKTQQTGLPYQWNPPEQKFVMPRRLIVKEEPVDEVFDSGFAEVEASA